MSKQKPVFDPDAYVASKEERELVSRVFGRFEIMRTTRDKQYNYFNARNLIDLIDDSSKRFNSWIDARTGPEDWGAKTVDPMTRNKVIFIIASLASKRLDTEFFKQDDDDKIRAKIIKAFHEYSYDYENQEMQTFYEMLSAVVKGTVVGYEGFKAPTVDIKKIDTYDAETGKTTYKKISKKLTPYVCSEIVPLEDFYPGDIRQRNIQKMPDCAWRSVLNYATFQQDFKKYPNMKHVKPGLQMGKTDAFYNDVISSGLQDDEVEVLRYFNKIDDEFVIIADGILLTPLDSPLVWNHKEKGLGLPFWSTIYEPFDEKFFYGKPLPDKLRSNQDVVDALYRMLLDQTFLSIHKPVLTSAVDSIEDELMRPGRKIPVSDVNEWKELDISSPDAAQFKMLEIARRSIEEASSDSVTQPTKTGIPATAYANAQQGAETLMSMFQKFMEWGAQSKAELRVSNILQFYPLPIDEKDGKTVYRKVRVDNVPLMLRPWVGSLIIRFVPSKAELDPMPAVPEEMKARFEDRFGKTFDHISVKPITQTVEMVSITPEFLEDFQCGVRIVANSSVKENKELKKALELEFIQRVVQAFPDLVKRDVALRDLIDVYEKSPDEYMIYSPSEQEMAMYRAGKVAQLGTPNAAGGPPDARASSLIDQMTGGGAAGQQMMGDKTGMGMSAAPIDTQMGPGAGLGSGGISSSALGYGG